MEIRTLTRKYRYDGMDLPVPQHLASNETALRAFHATLHPAITTATATETVDADGNPTTEYRRAVGTKGAH